MNKTSFTFILNLFIGILSFAQDTIQWHKPPNGYFWINKFDSTRKIWVKEEYIDYSLFSIIELDSSKLFPAGKSSGYFKNGNIAFKRYHYFDGEHSYLQGKKQVFFPNRNIMEDGEYFKNIKIGNWTYFNEKGDTVRFVQFKVPHYDTISDLNFLNSPPKSRDTISFPEMNEFIDTWPIINYGKNGLEVLYQNNLPIKVNLYEYDKLIMTETSSKKIKKLLLLHK